MIELSSKTHSTADATGEEEDEEMVQSQILAMQFDEYEEAFEGDGFEAGGFGEGGSFEAAFEGAGFGEGGFGEGGPEEAAFEEAVFKNPSTEAESSGHPPTPSRPSTSPVPPTIPTPHPSTSEAPLGDSTEVLESEPSRKGKRREEPARPLLEEIDLDGEPTGHHIPPTPRKRKPSTVTSPQRSRRPRKDQPPLPSPSPSTPEPSTPEPPATPEPAGKRTRRSKAAAAAAVAVEGRLNLIDSGEFGGSLKDLKGRLKELIGQIFAATFNEMWLKRIEKKKYEPGDGQYGHFKGDMPFKDMGLK